MHGTKSMVQWYNIHPGYNGTISFSFLTTDTLSLRAGDDHGNQRLSVKRERERGQKTDFTAEMASESFSSHYYQKSEPLLRGHSYIMKYILGVSVNAPAHPQFISVISYFL